MTLYERVKADLISQEEFEEAWGQAKTRYALKRVNIVIGMFIERLNHNLCTECKRKLKQIDLENWH